MKTAILPSAHDDLAAGFGFYERQREGLGSYFRECLFSDIESLQLYAGNPLESLRLSQTSLEAISLRDLLRPGRRNDSRLGRA